MTELQAQKDAEREWWDIRKAKIQSEFMKELDEGSPTATPAKPGVSRTSDDDTVLVEGGGPVDKAAGGASKKKKKGKN
jgi:translocation protein SEC66